MGDRSKIEWTDATWNPVIGCTRVSAGCDNCYAVRDTHRLAGQLPIYEGLVGGSGKRRHFTGVVRTLADRLAKPLRWKRPRRIFVNSMSDLFHPGVPDWFIDRVFAVMALADHHVFQVLTKRPERMAEYLNHPDLPWKLGGPAAWIWGGKDPDAVHDHAVTRPWPLTNVWVGTSVEDQAAADERIPHLLDALAAVRFLSCEPLLGPVDLMDFFAAVSNENLGLAGDPLAGSMIRKAIREGRGQSAATGIHQVIVGGESGPRARPMHPHWARALRDQCQAAGVAFFMKQWGEWCDPDQMDVSGYDDVALNEGGITMWSNGRVVQGCRRTSLDTEAVDLWHVGKKAAGRELDGRTWDEEPEVLS